MLAIAVGQSRMYWLDRRYRQQAGSYRGAVPMSGMGERIREGQRGHQKSQAGFQAASAAVAVVASSRGRVEVLRSGQPGMDGGGPTEQDRSEGMASISGPPNERGKSPWLLGAFPSDSP